MRTAPRSSPLSLLLECAVRTAVSCSSFAAACPKKQCRACCRYFSARPDRSFVTITCCFHHQAQDACRNPKKLNQKRKLSGPGTVRIAVRTFLNFPCFYLRSDFDPPGELSTVHRCLSPSPRGCPALAAGHCHAHGKSVLPDPQNLSFPQKSRNQIIRSVNYPASCILSSSYLQVVATS